MVNKKRNKKKTKSLTNGYLSDTIPADPIINSNNKRLFLFFQIELFMTKYEKVIFNKWENVA